MNRRILTVVVTVWAIAAVILLSSGATILILNSGSGASRFISDDDYEILLEYRRLEEIREALVSHYYIPVDEKALFEGAKRGMVMALEDPYTVYYDEARLKELLTDLQGEYRGIGAVMQLTSDSRIQFVEIYENSPAEAAGIQVGDYLLAVDGVDMRAASLDSFAQVGDIIHGEEGTPVQMMLERDGEQLELEVLRGEITVKNVKAKILPENIGYVQILQFTGNVVEEFRSVVEEFQEQSISALVIDLRGNPGGRLEDVTEIADMLLPEGVLTSLMDRSGHHVEQVLDAEYWDVPLTVLVNGYSASASELFAAAVQDYDRGKVIGTRTFGKGIVQTLILFDDDQTGLQMTTDQYFSPLGRSLHGVGVEPDMVVEPSENYVLDEDLPDPARDSQLRAAIELLREPASVQLHHS